MKAQNNSRTTQEATLEALTVLGGTSGGSEDSKSPESGSKKKVGRPLGAKTKIRNVSGAPTGKGGKEYEGVQEAYYKVATKDDEVWYTDGYQALVAYEKTPGAALYCGRKTNLMQRVR